MTAIIIIAVIAIVILSKANKQGNKRRTKQSAMQSTSNSTQKQNKKTSKKQPSNKKNEVDSFSDISGVSQNNIVSSKTIQLPSTNSYSTNNQIDESIIDVSNLYYNINQINNLKSHINAVPNWPQQYVYSHTELERATDEQKQFYKIFKENYLKGEYLDLEGNTNYAFILLFDLFNEYNSHNDLSKLEGQLNPLGQYYPKTKSYIATFLKDKKVSIGGNNNSLQIQEGVSNTYQKFDYDLWRLGSKYKTKLKLSDSEVNLLNRILFQPNNFNSIEFCNIQILKLYLNTVKELNKIFENDGLSFESMLLNVADIVARKQFRYKNGSQNYKYSTESTINELCLNIYKHCENTIREHYGHKRKINADLGLIQKDAKIEFESKVLSKITELLPVLVLNVTQPDEKTDIELYTQNTNRWKIRFEELNTKYNGNHKEYVEAIVFLGHLNKRNPSVENIFFEASKFIASHNKESALVLYIYYLHYDLKSTSFDNKQFTKSIQKNLFKTPYQFEVFERIVSEFISCQDLEKALALIPTVYELKRKKIKLDTTSIKEVQKQHSGTVELLNEYLRDEDEEAEQSTVVWKEKNSEEVQLEITHTTIETLPHTSNVTLTPIQYTTLDLFAKNNFTISQDDFEIFAKSKGLFKNQLIESINEFCYDFLGDVLIEEEDEYLTINTNYYQKIFTK